MAPSKASQGPPFTKDEQVLCFHGEMLYEAKILGTRQNDEQAWEYKIHYKGVVARKMGGPSDRGQVALSTRLISCHAECQWQTVDPVTKANRQHSWDDWVPQDRVRKFNEENKTLAVELFGQMKIVKEKAGGGKAKKGGRGAGSDFSSVRGSEERGATAAAQNGRGPRRGRDYDLENEDAFHARPALHLELGDVLKALLVDDWENVTRNQQLVNLPSPHPVSSILNDYLSEEKSKREPGSAEESLLEEIVAGIRVYFEKCLGRILLYAFERVQYLETQEAWNSNNGPLAGKSASDVYGPEHLARLLAVLGSLVAQTNMDQQSVNRMRLEMEKFCQWLAKHSTKYFAAEYEVADPAYIDKIRG